MHLEMRNKNLYIKLSDDGCFLDPCRLVDVTVKHNQMNKGLQGQDNLIIYAWNFSETFNKKLFEG